jgi:hypothetical protein
MMSVTTATLFLGGGGPFLTTKDTRLPYF